MPIAAPTPATGAAPTQPPRDLISGGKTNDRADVSVQSRPQRGPREPVPPCNVNRADIAARLKPPSGEQVTADTGRERESPTTGQARIDGRPLRAIPCRDEVRRNPARGSERACGHDSKTWMKSKCIDSAVHASAER